VTAETAESIGVLSQRFRPALLSFFRRRVGNHADAEDLTQEVLARIAARGGGIDAARPDGYVFEMAANLLRDRARRERIRQRYRVGIGAVEALRQEERDPDRVLQGRESLAAVVAALRELPERTRTVFILFRLENMKQRQIADMLGVALRTVEGDVIKASAHLRLRLGGES
jgi:RNA polymerase sigma-70 factor (ECF subfamily)